MSIFRNIVDTVNIVTNMVTASVSPYKIQTVKPEQFDGTEVVEKSQFLTLYKKPGCYDCVFANLPASPKYFSLFRLTKDGEAMTMYQSFNTIMTVLVPCTSSLLQMDIMQNLCDTIRNHPTWNFAHVAAFNGLFEAFTHAAVEKDLNQPDDVSKVTPIMAGLMGGQRHCVQEMVMRGANLNMADSAGNTVYHYAVKQLPEILEYLMEHDKDRVFDWVNAQGHTPLYVACKWLAPKKAKKSSPEKLEAVKMLLDGGADAGHTQCNKAPIHVAVELGELKCIELILKKYPDQKDAKDRQYQGRPLHWAKTRQVTERLCQLGCDVNQVSGTNHTPLNVMMMFKRTDCMIALLCYSADCNIGDSNGDTPLHIAVQNDNVDWVRLFVVFGADVNKQNKTDITPRHMAAISKEKNKDIILNMLHMVGAKRCTVSGKGCLVGCSAEGRFNGKLPDKYKAMFQLDEIALFDEMLCSVKQDMTDGKAVKDLTDEPSKQDKAEEAAIKDLSDGPSKQDKAENKAVKDLADGPSHIGDRVLCLDGGGIRGLVLIQMLTALEEAANVPVKELFDWIGGTSTGGLLALAVSTGKPLAYIRGMYFRLKDTVFKGSRPYSSKPFEDLLKYEFGDMVMKDIKHPKVIVTAVLVDRFPTELYLFRNYEHTLSIRTEFKGPNEKSEPMKPPQEQLLWKCARSSGAAPTYFRTFGHFMDGGLMSNNPTLDVLTEIHEYNAGLKLRNQSEKIQPLRCVVSLGTGRVPIIARDHFDVYYPSGLLEVHKVVKGLTALVSTLLDQASISEGRLVDRARAWCSMINVPFFRFSPQLSEALTLDCTDNALLINMMWDTQCYIAANRHRIQQVAQILVSGHSRQLQR